MKFQSQLKTQYIISTANKISVFNPFCTEDTKNTAIAVHLSL